MRAEGSRDELVSRGRLAVDRFEWDAAVEALTAADEAAPLDAPDLERLASAAYLLGRVDEALDALARAHQDYAEAGQVGDAQRAGFWIVFILMNRGETAQAGGWMARCSRLLEGLPPDAPERGYMLAVEAFRLSVAERRYAEAQEVADRVLELGRLAGDADLAALALTLSGRVRVRAGRPEEGLALLDEAMVSVVSGELGAAVAGSVYCSLIEACEEIAEHRRAQEWTEALTRWCERQHGMLTFNGQCLTHRATILLRRGEWKRAAEEARLACERFVGAADEVATGRALYQLAEVYRVTGDEAAAEETYRRASEWGHDPQPGLALLRVAQGRIQSALAAMNRALAETTDTVERIRLLPAQVEVTLAAGDLEAASAVADELERLAASFGTSTLRAQADQARGAVRLATGDAGGALESLRRACEGWREAESPYETARTRVMIGQACRALGDDDTANLELEAARRAFNELGAVPDLARISAGPSSGGKHPLTARELEVLRMVATGMTNQAIADELFLAVKTVDRHVANILTKLGVPSRTAATAYAYEHGLI